MEWKKSEEGVNSFRSLSSANWMENEPNHRRTLGLKMPRANLKIFQFAQIIDSLQSEFWKLFDYFGIGTLSLDCQANVRLEAQLTEASRLVVLDLFPLNPCPQTTLTRHISQVEFPRRFHSLILEAHNRIETTTYRQPKCLQRRRTTRSRMMTGKRS